MVLDSLLSMGGLGLLCTPWCAMSKCTNYLCLFYIYSRCNTLASVMAWSEAWLYRDRCVLVEYFLKWGVKTFALLFSQGVSTKLWPYKSANRIPCFRKCSCFTFNPAILVCGGIALLQFVDV